MAYTPDNVQIVKVHFDRVPSYSKEALLKSLKDEYKVEYVMTVDRPTTKVVVDASPPNDIEREETSKSEVKAEIERRTQEPEINKMKDFNKIGVAPEVIMEKANNLIKAFPSFNSKSETEKMMFIADLIGGKYDDIVFDNKTSENKQSSKPIQAYKNSEKA